MFSRTRSVVGASLAALVLSVGSASAQGTLTGSHTTSLNLNVALTVTSGWDVGPNNNLTTSKFNWNRSDLPAGMGVDGTIQQNFVGYCVEINQGVNANTQIQYVVTNPATAGFSANEITLFSRLWGEFFGNVNSPETSAAFQIAVYEIIFDADGAGLNTSGGIFSVQGVSSTPRDIAQNWLSFISAPGYAGGSVPIAILVSPTSQDQLVQFPAPGTGVMALGAVGLLARRRRA
jgi:hypothetical protein